MLVSVESGWTVGKIFEPSIFVDEFLFTVLKKMGVNQPTKKALVFSSVQK